MSEPEGRIESSIISLLAQRATGASICPSEVARQLGGEDWRSMMEPVRAAARRLVAAGDVEITQGGEAVDPETARGPIRIRRMQRSP
ncbi:DUF3253 domain-containing protein [Cryptosporangium sp. NPDC051539]|uniref:DUF3253 domain-containing protein n=1 Tax=Cryptosporangium sp. NPDC051539 TaxID=3363962 RepID=UPI0037A41F19